MRDRDNGRRLFTAGSCPQILAVAKARNKALNLGFLCGCRGPRSLSRHQQCFPGLGLAEPGAGSCSHSCAGPPRQRAHQEPQYSPPFFLYLPSKAMAATQLLLGLAVRRHHPDRIALRADLYFPLAAKARSGFSRGHTFTLTPWGGSFLAPVCLESLGPVGRGLSHRASVRLHCPVHNWCACVLRRHCVSLVHSEIGNTPPLAGPETLPSGNPLPPYTHTCRILCCCPSPALAQHSSHSELIPHLG